MKRETDVENGKAEYTKKKSVKFVIPEDFFENTDEEEMLKNLIFSMFSDLKENPPSDADSLGVWLQYETITVDNAVSLRTLEDILEYSKEGTNPIFEFVLMSMPNND
jgi:hypothetical protein